MFFSTSQLLVLEFSEICILLSQMLLMFSYLTFGPCMDRLIPTPCFSVFPCSEKSIFLAVCLSNVMCALNYGSCLFAPIALDVNDLVNFISYLDLIPN